MFYNVDILTNIEILTFKCQNNMYISNKILKFNKFNNGNKSLKRINNNKINLISMF